MSTSETTSVIQPLVYLVEPINSVPCDVNGKLIFHSLLPISNDRMNELFAKMQSGTLTNSERLAIAVMQGDGSAVWPLLDAIQEDLARPVPQLFAGDDPEAPKDAHRWLWCYLHGEAQNMCDEMFQGTGDTFMSDSPMPTKPGEYRATLYGRECIAVIAYHRGLLAGRVVFLDDASAVEYARNPSRWS